MFKRILICGCARSGNTLMFSLMQTGFDKIIKVIDGPGNEQFPEEIVEDHVVVGKMPKKVSKLHKLMSDDLGVICMMRDPRDVLVSRHFERPKRYWTPLTRWMGTAEIANEYKNHPNVLLVKYEDLILKSSKVQNAISKKFNLDKIRDFDECYEHFDKSDKYNEKTMNGIRPLDTSRIGSWKDNGPKEKFINKLMKNKDLVELMNSFGYN